MRETKKKVLEWFKNLYVSGNKDFQQIKDVHNDFKDLSYMSIRIIIVELTEEGYLESLNVGKLTNFNRCFRLNLDPKGNGIKVYNNNEPGNRFKSFTRKVRGMD